MRYPASELGVVRGELPRVDSKVSTMAGLAGAMAAFVATQVTSAPTLVMRLGLVAAGEFLVAATVVLLLALRPHLGQTGFCAYARMTDEQLERYFEELRPAGPPSTQAEQAIEREERGDLRVYSQICLSKYRRVRWAVDLAIGGVLAIGIVIALAVVA